MVAISNLLNRESAAGTVLDPKDAERLLSKVAGSAKRVMVDTGYAMFIAARSGVTNKRAMEIFGKSSSSITLYRRLGVALVAGIDPESETWRVLSAKSKANDAKSGIAELLDDPDSVPTADAIVAKVKENFTPDGKSRTAKAPVGKTGDGTEVPPQVEAAALVARLDKITRALDAEQWAEVETSLNSLIGRAVKRLAAAAKVAEQETEPVAAAK